MPVRKTGSPTVTPATLVSLCFYYSEIKIYTSFLVYLDGCLVAVDSNDFASEVIVANIDLRTVSGVAL